MVPLATAGVCALALLCGSDASASTMSVRRRNPPNDETSPRMLSSRDQVGKGTKKPGCSCGRPGRGIRRSSPDVITRVTLWHAYPIVVETFDTSGDNSSRGTEWRRRQAYEAGRSGRNKNGPLREE